PMGELTAGALGAVPMIISFWPILFGGVYGVSKRREAIAKREREEAEAKARAEAEAAMQTAVAKIGEEQGPEAAEKVKQALAEAQKAGGCGHCCAGKHGEGA
ncbi:MAG: hypothetical protein K2O70_04395, partial [Desulfovibrionaceae bacterium]|nr:hypothetical protein [Desulfovibrionaceae bacterium]